MTATADANQARLYAGYVRVAQRLGATFIVYRPTSAIAPLGHKVATLPASFSVEDYRYRKPLEFGKSLMFGWFDGAQTTPGDYLVGDRTFFVASQQPHLPILVVACNRRVQLMRMPAPDNSVGASGYSGLCDSEAIPALGSGSGVSWIGWPCSITIGGVRNRNTLKLPGGSSDQLGFTILLPVSVPLQFRASDVLIDDLGQTYSVAGCELTENGWRLYASEAHA